MTPLAIIALLFWAQMTPYQTYGPYADCVARPHEKMVYCHDRNTNLAVSYMVQDHDDPHEGQPATCSNAKAETHKCECQRATKCAKDQSKEEDSKCRTFCRPTACACRNHCTT